MANSKSKWLCYLTELLFNPFIVFLLGANNDPMIIDSWNFLWMPTLIGSILIVMAALLCNNLSENRSYPKYW